MSHCTRPTGLLTTTLFAFFLCGWLGTPCLAVTHNTNDGLVLSINGAGQTESLTVGGEPIAFSPGALGGFYIRDNTLLPSTNLPDGITNLIDCPEFQDGSGDECLDVSAWDLISPFPPEDTAITSVKPITVSDDYVAQVTIEEDPDSTGSTNWIPYRFTAPVDQRASTDLYWRSYLPPSPGLKQINTRAENNQLSIYPFSAIDVIKQSGARRGISFGENLIDDTPQENYLDPQVAHFGYRIERPGANFLGKYYVEFNLGLLSQNSGENVTPFAFILFRSDRPSTHESNSFRLATEKFEDDFFPSAFARPHVLPADDDWLFGGGIFGPQKHGSFWWDKGFPYIVQQAAPPPIA